MSRIVIVRLDLADLVCGIEIILVLLLANAFAFFNELLELLAAFRLKLFTIRVALLGAFFRYLRGDLCGRGKIVGLAEFFSQGAQSLIVDFLDIIGHRRRKEQCSDETGA